MDLDIRFSTSGDHEKILRAGLDKHSVPFVNHEIKDFGFYVYENEQIIAGICGRIDSGKWVNVKLLHVDKNQRGKDIGTKLIKRVEEYSRENNCFGVRLETWCFQARGFYEKMGFTIWGELKSPNATYYCLSKKL